MMAVRTKRSERFLEAVAGQPVAIVLHDNPDPDAIASGWALAVLVRRMREQPVRLLGRGAIVRAENVHMVRRLQPPLELVDELPHDHHIVLVDCVPTGRNHLLDDSQAWPVAVIDHHEPTATPFRVAYRDIRPRVVATATIAATYLREQGLTPERNLATALLFAMHTEIVGQETVVTPTDRSVFKWLGGLADHALVAEIEGAPLSREYFADLLLALENVFLYDGAAVCFLPRASGAEIVGEVADMVLRCAGVQKVLCGAAIGGAVILSVRTTLDGGDATELLYATLDGVGHGGGHEHRAGGKVPLDGTQTTAPETLYAGLKERWLSACRVDQQRGSRLVRKQAILENL
jgi:nanoRNase/pAp phosphatase (c-di-AMP/oligoRNAs hydrolase)